MARKMKDSGIEWIGEIPEGWEVVQLKRFAEVHNGREIDVEVNSTDSSAVGVYGSGGVFKYTNRAQYSGKAVLFGRKGTLGKPLYVEGQLWAVDTMYFLTYSNRLLEKFSYYQFLAFNWAPYITHTAIPSVVASEIVACYFPIPPLEEQAKIADYLDNGCASLDTILDKTRSSIEEYKKLKQAVITQAVTKGVRGKREMKDSGVEWIGKIPREFDPVQLKFFCKLITDGTHFSPTTVENGWPYITAGDVHGIGLDYNSAKRISEEDFQLLVAQGCQPLKGDVLLVKDGATTGRVGFVDSDTPCVILSSVAMLRPADKTDGHYLMYLLASDFLQKQILVSMAGSAMPRTTLTKLTKYIGLLPPLYEQKEIADHLDAKCAEIDKLNAKKEQLVKELESYKKSLIYEVVTGKREV